VDEHGRTPLDGAHYVRDVHPEQATSRLHLFDELIKVLEAAGGLRAAELPDDDNDNNNNDEGV
jgi:hypothetical protein